ncbi:hypothetical protein IQ266_09790 [filamentous cyanobacterium LEGE 11480]|uniref:Uncharacterized protein n=1 Tax=Romeriopsis navalis LEGE 11480 TaxID=2777977 RepID=A0A928Z469_9CYAN|nr:hypothetical protein [Romeriopsis navalis]MBE9030018.1 hypothetical protein [Romeriopsis navalis LEGE 11480]
MARSQSTVIIEGLTITTIIAAFVGSYPTIVHPAPAPIQSYSTKAQDLAGLTPQINAIGGEAEQLIVQPRTTITQAQTTSIFFRPAAPRTFYPGTLSPLPEDIFRTDQLPNALKLIETPIQSGKSVWD